MFWDLFPVALSLGMSSDEYWNGDPQLFQAFREAYRIKSRKENEVAWLHGLYFYQALGASLATAFGKKKVKYSDKPLEVIPKTKKEIEAERQREQDKITRHLKMMMEAQRKRNGIRSANDRSPGEYDIRVKEAVKPSEEA